MVVVLTKANPGYALPASCDCSWGYKGGKAVRQPVYGFFEIGFGEPPEVFDGLELEMFPKFSSNLSWRIEKMDPRLLEGFYRGLQAELRMWALGVFACQNSFSIYSLRTELKDSLQITQDYTGLKPQQFSSTSSGSTAVTDSQ